MDKAPIKNPPPPKPRRQLPNSDEEQDNFSDEEQLNNNNNNNITSTTNTIRRNRTNPTRTHSRSPPHSPIRERDPNIDQQRTFVSIRPRLLDEIAETTIGGAVKMKGELSFEKLLRIEGEFDGNLISKGSLIIGPKGMLTGPVENMKEVVIDGGKIIGNISVDKITIREKGQVHGNITAKTLRMDPECVIIGICNINPHAPEKMNLKGDLIKEDGKLKTEEK